MAKEDSILSDEQIQQLDELSWGDVANELDMNREMLRTESEVKATTNVFLGSDKGPEEINTMNLDFLLDINLDFTVEVGRRKMLVQEILDLQEGSIIELTMPIGQPLNIFVNDILIGEGTVMKRDNKFGIQITNIIREEERVDYLQGIVI